MNWQRLCLHTASYSSSKAEIIAHSWYTLLLCSTEYRELATYTFLSDPDLFILCQRNTPHCVQGLRSKFCNSVKKMNMELLHFVQKHAGVSEHMHGLRYTGTLLTDLDLQSHCWPSAHCNAAQNTVCPKQHTIVSCSEPFAREGEAFLSFSEQSTLSRNSSQAQGNNYLMLTSHLTTEDSICQYCTPVV